MYTKYADGVRLNNTGQVWSFVGYQKVSPAKYYDGGTAFHFRKLMMCFRPCSKATANEDGSCTSKNRFGPDKCCVGKGAVEGMPHVANDTAQGKEWLVANEAPKGVKRVPLEQLKRKDGLKVY